MIMDPFGGIPSRIGTWTPEAGNIPMSILDKKREQERRQLELLGD